MSELVAHNERLKTEVLKTHDFDGKYRITIEKIVEGKYENRYLVKSYTKTLLGYKLSTLTASNIETDFDGNRIVKIEFKAHRMLNQAILFAKYILKERYQVWLKMQ
ncbi:MAG: hypothetical protein N4A35_15180 [Flavobacteriales bacterium]|jgi:hypothetical protein|nr:hypothetical protein [Flavobacteriales bacterium]